MSEFAAPAAEGFTRRRSLVPYMAGLIQRTAEAVDDMWRSIWHDSSTTEKALVAVVLIVTGLAIPVIPIVFLARIIARG